MAHKIVKIENFESTLKYTGYYGKFLWFYLDEYFIIPVLFL